jgi:putative transposase
MHEVTNAILYLDRVGCQWRAIPHEFPPWSTVWSYFRQWGTDGTWQRIHTAFREQVRIKAGRQPTSSVAIIDSQAVKTTQKGGLAVTMGQKFKGHKRYLLVDTMGLILQVLAHEANIQDYRGKLLLAPQGGCLPRLKLIWADSGTKGRLHGLGEDSIEWFSCPEMALNCGAYLQVAFAPFVSSAKTMRSCPAVRRLGFLLP